MLVFQFSLIILLLLKQIVSSGVSSSFKQMGRSEGQHSKTAVFEGWINTAV